MTGAVSGRIRLRLRVVMLLAIVLLSSCGGESSPPALVNNTTGSDSPATFPTIQISPTTPFTPTAIPAAPAIALSDVVVRPGVTVLVTATLATDKEVVAAQVDLGFPRGARVARRPTGQPACDVNAELRKGDSSFTFQPNLCADTACSGMRALIWATDNLNPIPNGAILFSCTIEVDVDAPGPLTLDASRVIMSDARGGRIDGEGIAGVISVEGSLPQTPTQRATSTLHTTPTPFTTPTPYTGAPAVALEQITTQPGASTDISVTLVTGGATIAGAQFDLDLPTQVRVSSKANGRPFCRVNPDINKNATAFAFLPRGCAPSDCTTVRTVVVSLETVDPIPDGSVLVTCRLSITADAAGVLPLQLSNVVLSDPEGVYISGVSVDGVIVVEGPPLPSETPTATIPMEPTATVTATAVAAGTVTAASIVLDNVSAPAGSVVAFDATLILPNEEVVVGTQNDIAFPNGARVQAKIDGKPDCRVNPAIHKDSTSFVFQPPRCAGDACTGMRTIVLSLTATAGDQEPIPDGAVLYTCNLAIDANASATLPLAISFVVMSDPAGIRIPDAGGRDGSVTVN